MKFLPALRGRGRGEESFVVTREDVMGAAAESMLLDGVQSVPELPSATRAAAESLPAWSSCAETLAGLLAGVGVELTVGGEVGDHPIVGGMASGDTAWSQFVETMTYELIYGGPAVAIKETTLFGGVRSLTPLSRELDTITPIVRRDSMGRVRDRLWRVIFGSGMSANAEVYGPTGQMLLGAEDVFVVQSEGYNGITSRSILAKHRLLVQAALAAEYYVAYLWGRGTLQRVKVTVPAGTKEEEIKKLEQRWREVMSGLARAHGAFVTEEGITVEEMSPPARDSQVLESRKLYTHQIIDSFGLPLAMVAQTSETGAAAVLGERDLIQISLFPGNRWAKRWASAIRASFPEIEDVRFNLASLNVASARDLAGSVALYRRAGALTINEARAMIGQPLIDDEWANDPRYGMDLSQNGGREPGANEGDPEDPNPDEDVVERSDQMAAELTPDLEAALNAGDVEKTDALIDRWVAGVAS